MGKSGQKKEKMAVWCQRTPVRIVKAAMQRASAETDGKVRGIHKRNGLVSNLLEEYGSGKDQVKP